jgi:hypothetical protein
MLRYAGSYGPQDVAQLLLACLPIRRLAAYTQTHTHKHTDTEYYVAEYGHLWTSGRRSLAAVPQIPAADLPQTPPYTPDLAFVSAPERYCRMHRYKYMCVYTCFSTSMVTGMLERGV